MTESALPLPGAQLPTPDDYLLCAEIALHEGAMTSMSPFGPLVQPVDEQGFRERRERRERFLEARERAGEGKPVQELGLTIADLVWGASQSDCFLEGAREWDLRFAVAIELLREATRPAPTRRLRIRNREIDGILLRMFIRHDDPSVFLEEDAGLSEPELLEDDGTYRGAADIIARIHRLQSGQTATAG